MRHDKDRSTPQERDPRSKDDTPPEQQRAGARDEPGWHPDPGATGQDARARRAQEHETRQSGQFGADEPDYGRPPGERPADNVGGKPNRAGPQYEEGGRYPGPREPGGDAAEDPEPARAAHHDGWAPGTRAARRDEPVRSRSADPGQSSYGGFSHENPSYQRQQMTESEDLAFYREARDPWGRQPGRDAPHERDLRGTGWQGGRGEDREWDERDQWREAQSRAWRDQPTYVDPKGYVRSDERVREIVCERLSRSGLDVSDVSVDVSEGTVTLQGTVADRRAKHQVEDCVDACAGVSDVDNRIKVAARSR
ncbi:BON domain-containing protein [Pseudomonadota bacterium AL_CKDN230030165-1A_HGKHYDSX7]